MSFSNILEGDILKSYFHGSGAASLWANAGAGVVYVRLFTANPLEAGGATSEQAYAGYAAIAVARTTAGWTYTEVDNGPSMINPAANIDFAVPSAAGTPSTHWGVSRAATGTVDMTGTLTPPLTMAANTIPRILTASVISLD